jgi:hypothetical protein
MFLPCGIGHPLPCGIPRAYRRDASSSFLQLTFASRAPAANTNFGDYPPSAYGNHWRSPSRSSSLTQALPLRFEEDAGPPLGHPASNGSCLTACGRLQVNRQALNLYAMLGERGSFFDRHTPRRSDPLTLLETALRRAFNRSVCWLPSTVWNRRTSIQPNPDTLLGLLSSILWSTSLDAREHASLGLPGLVLRRSWRTFRELEVPSIEEVPDEHPSREPAPATHIR